MDIGLVFLFFPLLMGMFALWDIHGELKKIRKVLETHKVTEDT